VPLAGGLVRRLLLRALLVLGGAFAATLLGWLLGAGSASADVLPQVPSIPQVLGAVVPQLSTPDLAASALPPVLPCSCLDTVTKQVHVAVSGVGGKITPATDLVHHVPDSVASPQVAAIQAPVVVTPRPVVLVARSVPVGRHHVVVPLGAHRPVPVPEHDRPRPAHHAPTLPPLAPAGSSDSGVHGTASVPTGAGADGSMPHVADGGRCVAGTSDISRLAAAPGRQPGTSPD
jgi:hypothetical protein